MTPQETKLFLRLAHEWKIRADELRRSASETTRSEAYLSMVKDQSLVYTWCAGDLEKEVSKFNQGSIPGPDGDSRPLNESDPVSSHVTLPEVI